MNVGKFPETVVEHYGYTRAKTVAAAMSKGSFMISEGFVNSQMDRDTQDYEPKITLELDLNSLARFFHPVEDALVAMGAREHELHTCLEAEGNMFSTSISKPRNSQTWRC